MTNYNEDRSFTDYVHNNLAVPIIYKQMNWEPTQDNSEYNDERDKQDGIDYVATDSMELKVTVQERFRDEYYKEFNDFTIRYTRECSTRPGEQKSEWFKIDATYLIYGITNGKKFPDKRHTLTGFEKYIVVNLKRVQDLFRAGVIRISENFPASSRIAIEGGQRVLYTAKKKNTDHSSEFIGIDPKMLKEVIGDEIDSVVPLQEGFY